MSELKERIREARQGIDKLEAYKASTLLFDCLTEIESLEARLADSDKAHTERARKHIEQIRREHEQQLSTVKAELEKQKNANELIRDFLHESILRLADQNDTDILWWSSAETYAEAVNWIFNDQLEQESLLDENGLKPTWRQKYQELKAELEEAHQEIASLQQCDCIERGAE